MAIIKEDIGKLVTFKLKACNWNPRKETRVIRDVLDDGRITVRHNGFDNFVLRTDEIIAIDGREVEN